MADPTQARAFVRSFIAALGDELAAFGLGPFGHHNDAETAAALFPKSDALANAVNAVGNLRD